MPAYSPDEARNATWTEVPTSISVSGSSAKNSTALAKGVYEITSDVDVYFIQGATGGSASTSSIPLWSKTSKIIYVTDSTNNGFIHVIQQSSAGTLWITRPVD